MEDIVITLKLKWENSTICPLGKIIKFPSASLCLKKVVYNSVIEVTAFCHFGYGQLSMKFD